MRFHILTSTDDALDDVLACLEGVETWGFVNGSKGGGGYTNGIVSARFSIELLPEVAAIEGVHRIDEPSRPSDLSSHL